MSVKAAIRQQYQAVVDAGAGLGEHIQIPPEGWLRTVRKALGMSGAQLARRMGVTRARVAQAEQAELGGGATLRSMQTAAEALGCRFIYAIVPPAAIESLIIDRARQKAMALVGVASRHMALEDQALPDSKVDAQVGRLMQDLIHEMPPDFWNDR